MHLYVYIYQYVYCVCLYVFVDVCVCFVMVGRGMTLIIVGNVRLFARKRLPTQFIAIMCLQSMCVEFVYLCVCVFEYMCLYLVCVCNIVCILSIQECVIASGVCL